MREQIWCGVVPSISAREGIDVTATVVRTSAGVEIAYSFDDPEQCDVEDMVWDAETCAAAADTLRLVEKALHAANDLLEERNRVWLKAASSKDPVVLIDLDRAQQAYTAAMAALPLVI